MAAPSSSVNTGSSRQLLALIQKNMLLTVFRRPLGFLLMFYGFPLASLALLLAIPSFLNSSGNFGVSSPQPIKDLASALDRQLVIIKPPNLGPDIDRVVETLIKPLDKNKVVVLDSELDLLTVCLADAAGVSNCFASVGFIDSPETKGTSPKSATGSNHTWQYTLRVDPAKSDTKFNVFTHNTDTEKTLLPLQLAVDNAITNRHDQPSSIGFTSSDKKRKEEFDKKLNLALMGKIYGFALFACFYTIIFRHVTLVTTERDSGMSQLVDGMGGRLAPAMRALGWLITIDVITLPCYILFGVLYWRIAFPSSSLALLVGWQILLGLAVNGSVAFAAAFFTKARLSAIYVIGAFLLLSVAAQAYGFQLNPLPQPAGAYILALLFTSSNALFFTQQMILWQYDSLPATITDLPKPNMGLNSYSYKITQATMLGLLGLQIVIFPLLAIATEYYMHGISFKSRTFKMDSNKSNGLAVQTFDLKKTYGLGFLKGRPVAAVDGINIHGYQSQILCLAGPNGSGKTTTLHMIAGLIAPTEGSVSIDAEPSQIGICPQRNIFWPELTVGEHVRIWSRIKGGRESEEQLTAVIHSCDLAAKVERQAKTLSGGQKRKLQLACMFVGHSTVCLIDECTSGLDPLSRRAIWEILLHQRAKRTIVFTTHFLDEVDVLADHMVILSKGKVKCQGAVAELKGRYGNGYQVTVANTAQSVETEYPCHVHQDRLVYRVPDSLTAATLSSTFAAAGITDIALSGPQIEDVFLNVAEDAELENATAESLSSLEPFKLAPSRSISFWSQVGALYRKRWTVLWRFWWPYFYVLALPIIIIPCLNSFLKSYFPDHCRVLKPKLSAPMLLQYPATTQCYGEFFCPQIYLGNLLANESMSKMTAKHVFQVAEIDLKYYNDLVNVSTTMEEWTRNLNTAKDEDRGGMFFQSESDTGFIAFKPDLSGYMQQLISAGGGSDDGDEDEDDGNVPQNSDPGPVPAAIWSFAQGTGVEMMNLYSQMRSGVEIVVSQGGFARKRKEPLLNTAVFYTVFFCLVQAIYPAAFVIYPATEKLRMVRSVQYANGVRRVPLWFAYGLFDFLFVLIISAATSVVMAFQVRWIGTTWIMLPVLVLYGLAAILQMYIVAHFVNGPLKSFLTAFGVGDSDGTSQNTDAKSLGITFGLFLIMPIGNVFKAMIVGFNIAHIRCQGSHQIASGSIYAYGGPILLLIVQILLLLGVFIFIEGDVSLFRKKSIDVPSDPETSIICTDEIETERLRVEGNDSDLLRIVHLDKSFGSNNAVSDVTLGLPKGEVLALLGPNGAGKSTLVNLIQSDLSADSGHIFLCGEDSRTHNAQLHLGVCPQYDAMDMLSTRQHLVFYVRIKGIENAEANVDHIMARLGLTPYGKMSATKLSGGNKRKLSLAIALIGTPRVLVLDEPTSAMDAVAKRSFWRIIQSVAPQHSVLLTQPANMS
ncbi:ABC transporter [Akanthomyces lecanii RCEF 1005]|uniref:ABC transporter n=1 Tax=Akanthomyces lecanii RCEF 1005 TaxID=1081108 RepID=A0A168CRL0_CORDF|nr:ABC transporter [Akanthomyces lecanii RCEF 1005]